MEGPSLVILKEELKPLVGQTPIRVGGNSKIGIKRLRHQKLEEVLTWGKHLLLKLGPHRLKVHFLMFGSYTLGRRKAGRTPRLQLVFPGRELNLYSCSVQFIDEERFRAYDWRTDPMSKDWDPAYVLARLRLVPETEELGDVLLSQELFSGVGNIIRNEVLHRLGYPPDEKIGNLDLAEKRKLIREAKIYCFQFYEWKLKFELRRNWKVFRRAYCADCGHKTAMSLTGRLQRRSFYCPACVARAHAEHLPRAA